MVMALSKRVVTAALATAMVSFYGGYVLGDYTKPYHREYGVASAMPPADCGLPAGPTPSVIRASGGDCVGPEWTIKRTKICDVTPHDPYVHRWIEDSSGKVIHLPLVHSLAVDGKTPPIMRKTFIQPKVAPGWVKYRARVSFACPVDMPLLRDKRIANPVHLIHPVVIDELSIEYMAVAD